MKQILEGRLDHRVFFVSGDCGAAVGRADLPLRCAWLSLVDSEFYHQNGALTIKYLGIYMNQMGDKIQK